MCRLSLLFAAAIVLPGMAFAQTAGTDSSQEQPTTPATSSQQINITMTRSSSQPSAAEQQEVRNNLKDVHFAFDQYDLDDPARQALQENANWLKANPGVTVSIAGNADERGDITYNLVLSQKRAEAVRDALVSLGVPAERIQFTTGWGKLYPVCAQADESCWAQNRRTHLTAGSTLQKDVLAMDKLTPAILACATMDCR
ncbi:MAG TPA: OmpA family protein [Terriglobales bacterium]|jgi:peptidoglycan-associated lipoprotein|nr:OmpA family protein [Terriglobales bacterium]